MACYRVSALKCRGLFACDFFNKWGAVGVCDFFNNIGAVRLLLFKNEITAEDYGKLFPHVENEIVDNMWVTFFHMWKTLCGKLVTGVRFWVIIL